MDVDGPSGSGLEDNNVTNAPQVADKPPRALLSIPGRSSSRIKALGESKKIKSLAEKDLNPIRTSYRTYKGISKFISRHDLLIDQMTARHMPATKPRAGTVIPFQQVKKGVYLEQVAVKTFKVSEILSIFRSNHQSAFRSLK